MRKLGLKSRIGLLGTAVAAGLALTAVVSAAVTWGPSRPTYTWAHPADHITFNSITDNPVWGDERFLVKARDINAGTNTYSTSQQVHDNQEFLVTTYFHNNADTGLHLVAHGVRVKMLLPSGTGTTNELKSTITADNSNPGEVFSTMDFTGNDEFSLEYVPGSARLNTNYVQNVQVSDSVVTNAGALVGTSGTNGQVTGCAQFSGYVSIKVKVHVKPKENPKFACNLLDVKLSDGRKVDARVEYTASGGATFKNVTFSWGDGQSTTTGLTNASHTYAKDDTYVINATLKFDVGGTEKTAECSQSIRFNTVTKTVKKVKKVTEIEKVTVLPETGAGGAVGLFAGASGLAGLGHYLVSRRRR